jgi:hypothetical protein
LKTKTQKPKTKTETRIRDPMLGSVAKATLAAAGKESDLLLSFRCRLALVCCVLTLL